MKASNSAWRAIAGVSRRAIARKASDDNLGGDSEGDSRGNLDGGSERDGQCRTMRVEVSLPHHR